MWYGRYPICTMTTMSGYFGPDSVTWRVHSDPIASLVGGLRSLIIQALDPRTMAGVAQHSDYRRRPLKRLQRTAEYVATTTFGTTEQAERAAAIVNHIHRKVVGIDPVTGRPYSAADPESAVWVHTVEIHSFLVAHEHYHGRLEARDRDRYFAENAPVAELLGVPATDVPADVEAVRAFFAARRPGLCVSDGAREAIDLRHAAAVAEGARRPLARTARARPRGGGARPRRPAPSHRPLAHPGRGRPRPRPGAGAGAGHAPAGRGPDPGPDAGRAHPCGHRGGARRGLSANPVFDEPEPG